jgi:hypothetical protein
MQEEPIWTPCNRDVIASNQKKNRTSAKPSCNARYNQGLIIQSGTHMKENNGSFLMHKSEKTCDDNHAVHKINATLP